MFAIFVLGQTIAFGRFGDANTQSLVERENIPPRFVWYESSSVISGLSWLHALWLSGNDICILSLTLVVIRDALRRKQVHDAYPLQGR